MPIARQEHEDRKKLYRQVLIAPFIVALALVAWSTHIYERTAIDDLPLILLGAAGAAVFFLLARKPLGLGWAHARASVMSLVIGMSIPVFGLLFINDNFSEKTFTKDFPALSCALRPESPRYDHQRHPTIPTILIDFFGTKKTLMFDRRLGTTICTHPSVRITYAKGALGYYGYKSYYVGE